MNNNISKIQSCQQIDEEIFNYLHHLERYAPAKLDILDTIFFYGNIFNRINPSQEKIANRAYTSRKHVVKTTNEFHSKGLILKEYRHRHTSEYFINPIFNNLSVRKQLKHLFKSFRWLPKVLLLSISLSQESDVAKRNNIQRIEVTPFIKQEFYKEDKLPNVSTSTYVRERLPNVSNNKVAVGSTNRKGDIKNWCSLNNEVQVLRKLKEELGLGEYEISQLSSFDENVLRKSYEVLKNTAKVQNRYRFFLGVCRNIQARSNYQKSEITTRPIMHNLSNSNKVGNQKGAYLNHSSQEEKNHQGVNQSNKTNAKLPPVRKNYKSFNDMPTDELKEDLEKTMKSLSSMQESYNKDQNMFMKIIMDGFVKRLQNINEVLKIRLETQGK